jgi:NAD(P)-dependent dehydrogenase (short-subunit alcohol dehydrogenase family)
MAEGKVIVITGASSGFGNLAAGQRPFRTHIDPSRDGSEVVSAVYDRIRTEFYHRVGIAELLPAHASL